VPDRDRLLIESKCGSRPRRCNKAIGRDPLRVPSRSHGFSTSDSVYAGYASRNSSSNVVRTIPVRRTRIRGTALAVAMGRDRSGRVLVGDRHFDRFDVRSHQHGARRVIPTLDPPARCWTASGRSLRWPETRKRRQATPGQ